MGQRLTQRIYECSQCEKVPEDGEHLWRMGNEIWCQECIDEVEKEPQEEEQPNTAKPE